MSSLSALQIAAFFAGVLLVSANPYCNLACGSNHTLCKRAPEKCGLASTCQQGQVIPITNDLKQLILDTHNTYRNKVASGAEPINSQPSAKNMKILVNNAFINFQLPSNVEKYNNELAYIAQCLSNTCQMNHDACRSTSQFSAVGQNLAQIGQSNKPTDIQAVIIALIKSWYDEVKYFNPNTMMIFGQNMPSQAIGHYTQLVWANTAEIGCGLTYFQTQSGTWTFHTYLLACNYGPAGNYMGQVVYEKGTPCTNCGSLSCNANYPALCGPSVPAANAPGYTPPF